MPSDIIREGMNTIQHDMANPKVINYKEFDFKNSAIIDPGHTNDLDRSRESIRRETLVMIDSRLRNTEAYPSPSRYVIDLDDDIPDVVSAELISIEAPFKTYLINASNNAFHVRKENGTKHKIVINIGNYSEKELCEMIENALENILSVKVEYNKTTDKFEFYSDESFQFSFDEKSTKSYPSNLGKLLGFKSQVYTLQSQNQPKYSTHPFFLIGEFRKNFDEKSYILLKITGFTVHHSISQIIDKTFAIIPETNSRQNYASPYQKAIKNFNPPIARLSKLQISFVDQNGDLVDFQNHDHYFVIRFESFKHIRKYASFLDMK